MQKVALFGLLSLCAGPALAHPGGAHTVQHGIEHTILALVFVLPAFMLLRRFTQVPRVSRSRRLPPRPRNPGRGT